MRRINNIILKILLIVVYLYFFIAYIQNREYLWFIDNFNLLIHEGGHMFFNFFGELIGIMGGTLFQIIIPISSAFVFIKQKDYFSTSFSMFWLGTNMFSIARYASDAQNQLLPLVHMGSGDPIHDWNYMFSYFNVLNKTETISNLFYLIGYIIILISIFVGLYFTYRTYWKK